MEAIGFQDTSRIFVAAGTAPFTRAEYCNEYVFEKGTQLLSLFSHTHDPLDDARQQGAIWRDMIAARKAQKVDERERQAAERAQKDDEPKTGL